MKRIITSGRKVCAFWLVLLCLATGGTQASTESEILRTKAQLAYSNQQYSVALTWLEQALHKDSNDLRARYYRGLTYARLQEYGRALEDLQQVAAAGADYPALHYELGLTAFRSQRYGLAEESLQRALQVDPTHHESAYYLGVSLHRVQHYEEALPPLRLAAQRGGAMELASLYLQAESLYHLDRRDEGREVLQRLISNESSSRIFDYHLYPFSDLWRSNEAEVKRSRALFAVAGMDLQRAEELLNQSVSAEPDDAHARYYRGVVASRRGEFGVAMADLQSADDLGIAHRELHHELGYVAYRQGSYDEASRQLRQGLADNPQHRRSHFYLGRVLQQQGEYDEALQQLQLAGEEGEIGAAALYTRADILSQLKRNDEARRLLQKIERDHPHSSYAERARSLDQQLARRGGLLMGIEAELSAGVVHDTNVALYSNDLPLPTTLSDRGDNRWQLGLDLKWKPAADSPFPVTLGYRLFQSRHQNLRDYDLRNHTLSASWKRQRQDRELGVSYQYLKASLNNYDYMSGHILTPHMMLSHSDEGLSLIKLQWRNEQYDYPNLQGYDGARYQASYRYFWLLGEKRYISTGLEAGTDQTDDKDLAARKYGINAAAQWDWRKIITTANLTYMARNFPDAQIDRSDKILKAGLRLRYPLSSQIQLEATINRIDNASDLPAYDYDRTVYGMTLKWKL